PASPLTSRSGCCPNNWPMPRRVRGWSSTIRIRWRRSDAVRGCLALMSLRGGSQWPRQRDRAGDLGPALGFGLDNARCPDGAGPIPHNPQPHARVLQPVFGQARAVVLDGQGQSAPIWNQADLDMARLAVFETVGHRLLSNAVEMSAHRL